MQKIHAKICPFGILDCIIIEFKSIERQICDHGHWLAFVGKLHCFHLVSLAGLLSSVDEQSLFTALLCDTVNSRHRLQK